jgi:hypothetical protein
VETYSRVGLDVLSDEAFRAMVLARIVEPTSKADSLRVLTEVGAPCPSIRTLYRALRRSQTRNYRAKTAAVLARFSSAAGRLGAMVMYDVTVRREALVVRVEVRDHHCGPGRSQVP